MEGDSIPLFGVAKDVQRKSILCCYIKDSGSVMIQVPEGSIIIYQHVLHLLKATSTVQMQILNTLRAVRVKVKALKKLMEDLQFVDYETMNQVRMEVRVNEKYSYSQALSIFTKYISKQDELPDDVIWKDDVTWKRYLGNLSRCFNKIEKQQLFRGRDVNKLTAIQKHHLARLFN